MSAAFAPADAQGQAARGMLYTDGVMVGLDDAVVAGLGGYRLDAAYGINDRGQIVAHGCDAATHVCQSFLLEPLPDAEVRVRVVEFYYPAFDHYFMTANATEIALLDAAQPPFTGWVRTGFSFLAYAPTTAPTSTAAVCRFLNDSFSPKSSHFFAAQDFGCEATIAGFPDWKLEDSRAFSVDLPDLDGGCRTGELPVYRLFNNGMGGVPNHRFITDAAEWQRMKLAHRTPEGNGAGVALCSAPL